MSEFSQEGFALNLEGLAAPKTWIEPNGLAPDNTGLGREPTSGEQSLRQSWESGGLTSISSGSVDSAGTPSSQHGSPRGRQGHDLSSSIPPPAFGKDSSAFSRIDVTPPRMIGAILDNSPLHPSSSLTPGDVYSPSIGRPAIPHATVGHKERRTAAANHVDVGLDFDGHLDLSSDMYGGLSTLGLSSSSRHDDVVGTPEASSGPGTSSDFALGQDAFRAHTSASPDVMGILSSLIGSGSVGQCPSPPTSQALREELMRSSPSPVLRGGSRSALEASEQMQQIRRAFEQGQGFEPQHQLEQTLQLQLEEQQQQQQQPRYYHQQQQERHISNRRQ